MSNNVEFKAGFPVLSVLGLIFITLKLTGFITWSWWWVLAPFWTPIALILSVLSVTAIIALLTVFLKERKQRLKK